MSIVVGVAADEIISAADDVAEETIDVINVLALVCASIVDDGTMTAAKSGVIAPADEEEVDLVIVVFDQGADAKVGRDCNESDEDEAKEAVEV